MKEEDAEGHQVDTCARGWGHLVEVEGPRNVAEGWVGHTWLVRYCGPCLLGKLGPLGKMGSPPLPAPGGPCPPAVCTVGA